MIFFTSAHARWIQIETGATIGHAGVPQGVLAATPSTGTLGAPTTLALRIGETGATLRVAL